MTNYIKIADRLEEDRSKLNKSILKGSIILILGLIIFSLISGVSAKEFNENSSSNDIQSFINNSTQQDNTIILNAGNYDKLKNLNITRSVNISSKGQVNIKGNGGILFNITAKDIIINKLNISGYQTAIRSNTGGISVGDCNISTSDISVHFTGSNLIDISLENNTIISSISNKEAGAIYINAKDGSTVYISLRNNNITANGSKNSIGVNFYAFLCNNKFIFENNNITGIVGIYLYGQYSENNIRLINNNINGNNINGNFMDISNCDDGVNFELLYGNNNLTLTNNNITSKLDAVFLSLLGSKNNINFTNNNFKGYEGGITISEFQTDLNITLNNNNIIGISIDGLWIAGGSNNITLNLANNNITGYYSSISLDSQRSNVTVELINNNLTGLNEDGINWWTPYSNNISLNLANNNIKGSSRGIYLQAQYSNNINGILNNNNITGSTGPGIYWYTINSENIINFTNNNVTGTYGYSMWMYVDKSVNSITFVSNNFLGNNKSSVYFSGHNSSNNLNLTNNSIKGEGDYAINLKVSDSNNTITFTKNNITGISGYGIWFYVNNCNNSINFISNKFTGNNGASVYLDGTNSNNTIFKFFENDFIGKYGFYAYASKEFSGLSLVNNTFNNSIISVYFQLSGAALSNVNITGNTIFSSSRGILFEEKSTYDSSFVRMKVNYNRIISTIGLDYRSVTDNGSNFDYNWWGINDVNSKIFGFTTKNHYVLWFTNISSLNNLYIGDKLNFALLVLNTTMKNEGVENLPYFVINGTFNGVFFDSNRDNLFLYQFKVLKEGSQFLEAILDEEYANLTLKAFKINPDIKNPNNNTDINDTNIENPNNDTDIDDSDDRDLSSVEINEDTEGNINNTSDILNVHASMKPTGVPIAIILILVVLSLVTYRRN